MTPKALLIPIAAFAVTVTGVHAFNPELLRQAGLPESQIQAFEQARDLHEEGDREAAREVLEEAGVDIETMEKVRKAMHKEHHERHTAIDAAVETNDLAAFKAATFGSPIADIVTSADDFAKFREAHDLRKDGAWKEAHSIMEEFGFTLPMNEAHGKRMDAMVHGKVSATAFDTLTDEQKAALQKAREEGDYEAMRKIWISAGIEMPEPRRGMHGGEMPMM